MDEYRHSFVDAWTPPNPRAGSEWEWKFTTRTNWSIFAGSRNAHKVLAPRLTNAVKSVFNEVKNKEKATLIKSANIYKHFQALFHALKNLFREFFTLRRHATCFKSLEPPSTNSILSHFSPYFAPTPKIKFIFSLLSWRRLRRTLYCLVLWLVVCSFLRWAQTTYKMNNEHRKRQPSPTSLPPSPHDDPIFSQWIGGMMWKCGWKAAAAMEFSHFLCRLLESMTNAFPVFIVFIIQMSF